MKVVPFKIPKTEFESIRVQIDKGAYFYDTLHKHPEVQLTLIIKGEGNLLVGDYFGNFGPGEIFLIGSNASHIFRCNESYYQEDSDKEAYSISIFFDKKSLGHDFLNLPESSRLEEWFNQPYCGLRYTGNIVEKITPLILDINKSYDFDRLVKFIILLKELISSNEVQVLSYVLPSISIDENEGKKLVSIFQFTFKNFKRKITIEEVSELAFMSPTAFCRYFKSHTTKTYVGFLNEVRIAHACALLSSSDLNTIEICFQSGFNNLSNFNKYSKKSKELPLLFTKD